MEEGSIGERNPPSADEYGAKWSRQGLLEDEDYIDAARYPGAARIVEDGYRYVRRTGKQLEEAFEAEKNTPNGRRGIGGGPNAMDIHGSDPGRVRHAKRRSLRP
jgi:hypothetical protein